MQRWWLFLVVLATSACGVLPGSQPAATPTPAAAPAPTAQAAASPAPTSPGATAVPKPAAATATPAPSAANKVYVGNTDGEGVFVRNTPAMADRARAYPDGTELTIIGDDVDGDGQHWRHVRTPDGLEGFVPSMYTTNAPS